MKFARIENSIVMETIGFNPSGRFHPALMWAPCADQAVVIGDLYDEATGLFSSPPPPPIDDLRAAARAAINAWRDAQRAAGFAAIGHDWDSTRDARENITNVAMAGQGSPTGTWTSAADDDVPVTAADMMAIYMAMLTRGAAIHSRQRVLKSRLLAMTREELAAFAPGWPA